MRLRTRRLTTPIFALGLLVQAAKGLGQAPPTGIGEGPATPVKILLTMERVYRACASYRDTGQVTTTILTEGGRAGGETPFDTAFVRPGRFRFHVTDTGLGERSSSYIVWSEGDQVRSWWDAKPGVREAGSLQEALRVATGISGGASMRVPGLLLPQEMGAGPLLVGPERIEDAPDRDVACFRIRGRSQKTPYTLSVGGRLLTVRDETITFWIDRASSLLRKVVEERTFDTYRSESVTTYSPEINVEIPASQLAFNAPGEKQ